MAKPRRLQFQVTFTAEETLTARTVLEALQQAEARGATDIKSITRPELSRLDGGRCDSAGVASLLGANTCRSDSDEERAFLID